MNIRTTNRELGSEKECRVTITYTDDQNVDLGYLKYTEPDNNGEEIIIQELYVKPDARRKGIAGALIDRVKEIAGERAIEVYIEPREKGITLNSLVSLFQRNGFYVRKINSNAAWGIFNH